MTGFWLVSYVALWLLCLALAVLCVGTLRQVGAIRLAIAPHLPPDQRDQSDLPGPPALEHDGPSVGALLPTFTAAAMNRSEPFSSVDLPDRPYTCVVFLSPTCESCQHITDDLNALAVRPDVNVIVVLMSRELAAKAFIRLFPLDPPVICDEDQTIANQLFNVHRNPFGLLYDQQRALVRKGQLAHGREAILALFGDPRASAEASAHVYPPIESRGEVVAASS
jgi:hypothetical protein